MRRQKAIGNVHSNAFIVALRIDGAQNVIRLDGHGNEMDRRAAAELCEDEIMKE